jgi:hypothetical protein
VKTQCNPEPLLSPRDGKVALLPPSSANRGLSFCSARSKNKIEWKNHRESRTLGQLGPQAAESCACAACEAVGALRLRGRCIFSLTGWQVARSIPSSELAAFLVATRIRFLEKRFCLMSGALLSNVNVQP